MSKAYVTGQWVNTLTKTEDTQRSLCLENFSLARSAQAHDIVAVI